MNKVLNITEAVLFGMLEFISFSIVVSTFAMWLLFMDFAFIFQSVSGFLYNIFYIALLVLFIMKVKKLSYLKLFFFALGIVFYVIIFRHQVEGISDANNTNNLIFNKFNKSEIK